MNEMKRKPAEDSTIYLVGSGIATLASAYFLLNDAGVSGKNIHILEQDSVIGGACDGSGNAEQGYVIRGGRMHEAHYVCYWDMLSHIPSYDDPNVSVTEESFAFSRRYVSNAKARLLKNGEKIDTTRLGLSLRDKINLLQLILTTEHRLANMKIEDWFSTAFFSTTFWYLWTSMFAFQRWSSLAEMRRYLRRFIHLVEGLGYLGGIMRTRYNQYHSVIVPLQRYLQQNGVRFQLRTRVADIDFEFQADKKTATAIHLLHSDGQASKVALGSNDVVLITNGSITDSTSQGTWTTSPVLKEKSSSASWMLWQRIANKNKEFGNPGVFSDHIELQKWYSFTVTLQDATFHNHMQTFSGNVDGTGGLVTMIDSNWLMSIVIAHQPHFPDQPESVKIFWGYGLYPERKGNYVQKTMSACSGAEILQELWYHLKIQEIMQPFTNNGKVMCIPAAMPFIDSAFMPRAAGDRPDVVPAGASNFAFIGQFAELPDECAFTVEYSVRSAQTAVYELFETNKAVPPIYDSIRRPGILIKAIQVINR
ncbi:MAG: oleate hydratase [Nitrosomonas sp.]|nr:MAG: oleate hydratase [Nitrosomonas sp.]